MSELKKLSPEDIELYRIHGDDIAHLCTLAEHLADNVDCKGDYIGIGERVGACAFCSGFDATYGCLVEEIKTILERITLP